MRILACLVVIAFFNSGCAPQRASTEAARFHGLADEFIQSHFAFRPLEGVALGWHEYDGRFAEPDGPALASEKERLKRFEAEFAGLAEDALRPAERRDLALLRSVIAGQRWAFEVQQAHRRNPMQYAGALDVSVYLKRAFKPWPERVRDITAILRHVPALFAAARQNLDPVLPRPFVETAIEVAQGTASFLEKDVADAVHKGAGPGICAEFDDACRSAVEQLRAYTEWLKREKLPSADDSFALGSDGYRAMLKAELVDESPEQILEMGLRELRAEQERFAEAAAVIDPGQKPIDVFKAMQRDHPSADDLIPSARQHLESIRQFLVDRRIVSLPSSVRPKVEPTLPPFRSTSFASMDTPGPFERRATDAYYYVTPVEPDWSPQQAEEWLTAFNFYTTDVVSIHEVYPGHYVQFLALNASPASRIEKAFYSYAFVEGWAHYAEQMMIEQGFQQTPSIPSQTREQQVRAAKYRLAQSDEALLRLCRLCCSVKLHTQGMTVDQATQFFMDNCYYEPKPARQEALRGTFDPGYLYYTLGKLTILRLREDWHAQEGARFSLQRFHDEFLRHGAPPIALVRQAMLNTAAAAH